MTRAPLLEVTADGLFCARGNFHIDPWRAVDRAIITHAHADHARRGSEMYLCSEEGQGVLRARLGEISLQTLPWGEFVSMNGVRVSLHPAGHLLGSAQVRVESEGEVWVVSGDYKTVADPTCTPFEPVKCDVYITESTFGLPVYRWPPAGEVFSEINDWWRSNSERGWTSVLFAYSLGKAQRLLAGIDNGLGPILVHGSLLPINDAYVAAGVKLPETRHSTVENAKEAKGRALVIAPPSAMASPWMKRFSPSSVAMASGWMRIRGTRRRRAMDRGFVLSDHADWPGLMDAIKATGATRIAVTHGYTGPMVRWLREQGYDAWELRTRYTGESDESDEAPALEGPGS